MGKIYCAFLIFLVGLSYSAAGEADIVIPKEPVIFKKFTLTVLTCNQQNPIRTFLKCFQKIKQIHLSGARQADCFYLMICRVIFLDFKALPERVGVKTV